jgi:hypothetical protein
MLATSLLMQVKNKQMKINKLLKVFTGGKCVKEQIQRERERERERE